ncbi:NAD(P)-dependent dehydrogenase (short-subunit alcohol dehydrogenase family) [Rhizobium sp. BK399]|nr:NAD(P)-dependent dehydrogenase (short-subunit alcohol dehydrogenase family) [Rhizobium sp. BK399]
MFDLSGQVAVVTGANPGLGQAIAVALAAAGDSIVAVGRTAMDETEAAVARPAQVFRPSRPILVR